MKGTDHFKTTIQNYLEQRAQADELFASKYANPKKNIDDCITCILNTVKNSGICGFTDDEVYSMAVHYYDEENIKVGNPVKCRAVVNHEIVLTEEEKAQARKEAIKKVRDEAFARMKQGVNKPKVKQSTPEITPTLFDM